MERDGGGVREGMEELEGTEEELDGQAEEELEKGQRYWTGRRRS